MPDRAAQDGRNRVPLTAFISVEPDRDGEALIREVQRTRGVVSHVWPMPDRFPGDVDVVLATLTDTLHERLPWMPGEATAALIVILPQHACFDARALRSVSPDAVLFRPVQSHHVETTLMVARSQFQYTRRLRARISRLDENIKASRDIERAKAILVESRNMSEEAAYAFLRTQAMERRVSVAALAAAFVDSYSLIN